MADQENGLPTTKHEHLFNYKEHYARKLTDQEKRRSELLRKQKSGRQQALLAIRELEEQEETQLESDGPMEATSTGEISLKGKAQGLRAHFARMLMSPEWLISVPDCLNGLWYIMPRPEGRHCLVIASRNRTSGLPGGGHTKGVPGGADCVLDCIYQEQTNTYYVLDMISWRGYSYVDSSTDFRFFWMFQKLAEVNVSDITSNNHYRFVPVPRYECNIECLQGVYSSDFGFVKDGILFYHKGTKYEAESTPLVLVWKDGNVCSYFTDTVQKSQGEQTVMLEVTKEGALVTCDDPPVQVGSINTDTMTALRLTGGALLRFNIFVASLEPVQITSCKLAGRPIPLRGIADSWTKIVFNFQLRTHTVPTIDHIAASASQTPVAFVDDVSQRDEQPTTS